MPDISEIYRGAGRKFEPLKKEVTSHDILNAAGRFIQDPNPGGTEERIAGLANVQEESGMAPPPSPLSAGRASVPDESGREPEPHPLTPGRLAGEALSGTVRALSVPVALVGAGYEPFVTLLRNPEEYKQKHGLPEDAGFVDMLKNIPEVQLEGYKRVVTDLFSRRYKSGVVAENMPSTLLLPKDFSYTKTPLGQSHPAMATLMDIGHAFVIDAGLDPISLGPVGLAHTGEWLLSKLPFWEAKTVAEEAVRTGAKTLKEVEPIAEKHIAHASENMKAVERGETMKITTAPPTEKQRVIVEGKKTEEAGEIVGMKKEKAENVVPNLTQKYEKEIEEETNRIINDYHKDGKYDPEEVRKVAINNVMLNVAKNTKNADELKLLWEADAPSHRQVIASNPAITEELAKKAIDAGEAYSISENKGVDKATRRLAKGLSDKDFSGSPIIYNKSRSLRLRKGETGYDIGGYESTAAPGWHVIDMEDAGAMFEGKHQFTKADITKPLKESLPPADRVYVGNTLIHANLDVKRSGIVADNVDRLLKPGGNVEIVDQGGVADDVIKVLEDRGYVSKEPKLLHKGDEHEDSLYEFSLEKPKAEDVVTKLARNADATIEELTKEFAEEKATGIKKRVRVSKKKVAETLPPTKVPESSIYINFTRFKNRRSGGAVGLELVGEQAKEYKALSRDDKSRYAKLAMNNPSMTHDETMTWVGAKDAGKTLATHVPEDRSSAYGNVLARINVFTSEPGDTIGQKITDLKNYIHKKIVSDISALGRFTKEVLDKEVPAVNNPWLLARLLKGLSSEAEAFIESGWIRNYKTEKLENIGTSLKDAVQGIDLDDLRVYMTSRRAALDYEPRGLKTGIDPEHALEAMKELEAKAPNVKAAAEKIDKFQDTLLQFMANSEFLDEKDVEAIRELNKHYVPMNRVFLEEEAKNLGGRKLANVPNPIKRISKEGSERVIVDPLESVVKNTYVMMSAAERNKVALEVARAIDANPEKAAAWGVEVSRKPLPIKFKMAEIKKTLKEFGADLEPEQLQSVGTIFRPKAYGLPKNTIMVRDKGTTRLFKLDEGLYEALAATDAKGSGIIMKILSAPAKALRIGATRHPWFAIKNLMRDNFTAYVNSKYGFKPFVDPVNGLAHLLEKDDVFRKWQASGGQYATIVSLDRTSLNKSLVQLQSENLFSKMENVIAHPIDLLSEISQASEESTRIAEYKNATRSSEDLNTALRGAFESRELTVDFAEGGSTSKQLNKATAFFNAAIQGNLRMIRRFREAPVEATAKAVALLTAPSVGLYLMNRKNPDYFQRPRWQKDLFWHIDTGKKANGETRWILIPKPFELGVVFSTIPERFMEYADKHDPSAFDHLSGRVYDTGMPSFIPTALLPVVEIASNKNMFTGRPIIPRAEEGLEASEQHGPETSEPAKAAAKVMNGLVDEFPLLSKHLSIPKVSPRHIDHIINSWTSSLGRDAAHIIGATGEATGLIKGQTIKTNPVPFGLRTWVVSSKSPQAQSIIAYWEEYADTQKIKNTFEHIRKEQSEDAAQRYYDNHAQELLTFQVLDHYNGKIRNLHQSIKFLEKDDKMEPELKQLKYEDLTQALRDVTLDALEKAKERTEK